MVHQEIQIYFLQQANNSIILTLRNIHIQSKTQFVSICLKNALHHSLFTADKIRTEFHSSASELHKKHMHGFSATNTITCCRLRHIDLGTLLLLGNEGWHAAQLGKVTRRSQAAGLQLLWLHFTYIRRV